MIHPQKLPRFQEKVQSFHEVQSQRLLRYVNILTDPCNLAMIFCFEEEKKKQAFISKRWSQIVTKTWIYTCKKEASSTMIQLEILNRSAQNETLCVDERHEVMKMKDIKCTFDPPDHLLMDRFPNIGPLISHGNLAYSNNAETKGFRTSKNPDSFVSAIFEFVNFPTRYEWSKIRGSVQ